MPSVSALEVTVPPLMASISPGFSFFLATIKRIFVKSPIPGNCARKDPSFNPGTWHCVSLCRITGTFRILPSLSNETSRAISPPYPGVMTWTIKPSTLPSTDVPLKMPDIFARGISAVRIASQPSRAKKWAAGSAANNGFNESTDSEALPPKGSMIPISAMVASLSTFLLAEVSMIKPSFHGRVYEAILRLF